MTRALQQRLERLEARAAGPLGSFPEPEAMWQALLAPPDERVAVEARAGTPQQWQRLRAFLAGVLIGPPR